LQKKLLKGLDEQEQQEARIQYKEARLFRKNLQRVLEEEIKSLSNSLKADSVYEKAGWEAIFADRMGQIKATERLLDMIKLEKI
jgi:hypothetical protein